MAFRAQTFGQLRDSLRGPETSGGSTISNLNVRDRAVAAGRNVSAITEKTAKALKAGGGVAVDYVNKLSVEAWNELKSWAAFRQPNYWYIFFNAIQIVTCLAVLIIGFVCIQEARDDLKANVAFKLMDGTTSKVSPCGYPAPDVLHLLRLQGEYEYFGLPQLIEPDYNRWNNQVQGSMCASDPYWTTVGNDGVRDSATSEKARLLHGLATIMGRRDLEPLDAANDAHLLELETNMLNDMCNTASNRTYSKRLHSAFGDPMTRIARAYLAAAPAFYRYQQSKSDPTFNGGSCLGDLDPFGYTALDPGPGQESMCSNADYVTLVLQRAGSIHNSARLAGIGENTPGNNGDWHAGNQFVSGPLEMLYALYALSVINHYDRTDNAGVCFKNNEAESAVAFCEDLYGTTDFNGYTLPAPTDPLLTVYGATLLDVNYYRISDEPLDSTYKCSAKTVSGIELATSDPITTSPSPSPPPFISYRGADAKFAVTKVTGQTNAASVRQHVIGSCAATLQYGLYDQERLFGVPDVLHFFQHDNRPDASIHFLGGITANSYFLGPLDEVDAFKRPVERLELYLAYRLASLTLWGSMIACVTGFFMSRSAVPLVVATLSILLNLKKANGVKVTIVQPGDRSAFQDAFTILASVVALFVGYYTLFVDPSAQSYYPTTPKCDDYILGKKYAHSTGGAYVTSWGKRRFNRYSETQIGLVIMLVAIVPAVYTITKIYAQSSAKTKREKRIGMTIFNTAINAVYFTMAASIVAAQAYNCINTGNKWMDAARVSPYDTTALNDRLGRDCLAMVLMSFWAGLAFSVNRASWVFNDVQGLLYKILFYGGCIFAVWLNQISYLSILPDEYAEAFAYPSQDDHRRNAQLIALGASGVFTIAIVWEFTGHLKEKKGADIDQASQIVANKDAVVAFADGNLSTNDNPITGVKQDSFFKLAKVHIDPRALIGAAPAGPQSTGATAAAAALARLPLSREQRRAPIGTRSRGQYAPMTEAPMPHLNLRH